MRKAGIETEERDLAKTPFTASEVDALIGKHDHVPFLNPRNELFRQQGFKGKPPSREETVKLIAREPNLLRRPLIVAGSKFVFGFDEDEYRALVGKK